MTKELILNGWRIKRLAWDGATWICAGESITGRQIVCIGDTIAGALRNFSDAAQTYTAPNDPGRVNEIPRRKKPRLSFSIGVLLFAGLTGVILGMIFLGSIFIIMDGF